MANKEFQVLPSEVKGTEVLIHIALHEKNYMILN
jgi:hypothetical protein